MPRVVFQNVCKQYVGPGRRRVDAVRDLCLTVRHREFLILVGPSGCGKTTALRLLAGLEEPSSGGIEMDGRRLDKVAPGRRDVAMVFQHHALFPHLTVLDNLALGPRIRREPKVEWRRRVEEAVEVLGLQSLLERRPAELSGGERQRVALGRALVRCPKVMLLDEPLAHLDLPRRLQMRAELLALHERLAWTTIYVTHDQGEALPLAERVAVMRHGAIEQVDTPLVVYGRPETRFVAEFLGSPPMNLWRGEYRAQDRGAVFVPADGAPRITWEDAPPESTRTVGGKTFSVIVGLRPEDVAVFPEGSESGTGGDVLVGQIEELELLGSQVCVRVRLARDFTVLALVSSGSSCAQGQRVRVRLPGARIHLFDPATNRRWG